jgi:signal transduction histidine kinase/DNA-binding response OmpR family regulator/ligand-binding sensor domain-containing protein
MFSSAQYIFRHIDFVDGLSDNQIRSLSLTPDGRLAIKTASILNLYNGATFEHFYQDKWKEYKWEYAKLPKEYYDNKGRIWMKERDYLLLFDLNTNQFVYTIDEELSDLGIKNKKLINLFIDEAKNYWFVTEDSTFYFYDVSINELSVIIEGNGAFTKEYGVPREMTQYKNSCWIVYTNGLLRCWDYTSKEFVSQDTSFLNRINETTDRIYIHTTPAGNLWLMYNYGISFYNRIENRWTEVATISGLSNFFTCMDLDREENVWIGTSRSGLRYVNAKTFKVEVIPGLKTDNGGSIFNDIHSVFVDDNNGVWVGTLFQGLCYYQPGMKKFRLNHVTDNEVMLTNEVIRCFLEDKDGTVLVGASDGLYQFNPETGKSVKIFKNQIENDLCLSLYRDSKDRIWIATYFNGFYCIDGDNIRNYKKAGLDISDFPNVNNARAIYEDKNGDFWAIVMGGAGKFNPETGEIQFLYKKHPKIKFHRIDYNFFPWDDDTFAVIGESGIYYYNTKLDSVWAPEIDSPSNPKFRDRGIKYYCVYKDSRSLEWFGTEEGLRIWDEGHKKRYEIGVTNGLPNNSISAIQEDAKGFLWVSTVSGISRIEVHGGEDGYEFSFVNFNTLDGLQSGKFYDRSSLKTSNGDMYFGGVHGFNSFNPQNIIYNGSKHKPLFTAFKLFNASAPLQTPVNRTEEIKLDYNENFITLEFAGLNYVNPTQTYFKYKLENFDKQWTEILTNGLGSVTYTGLQPGTYRLVVYTANNDKVWGDEAAEITILIRPPFWATIYAYIFYILLILTGAYFIVVYVNRKNQLKLVEHQQIEKRKQEEELDQMKFRFFTNISHEFRTPLTLIMTPLDALIKQQKDESLKQKLSSIYRNANGLLELVNQLLDFRKLEMHGEKPKLSQGDFVRFIAYVNESFKEQATSKNIGFTLESDCKHLFMSFDKDKIRKVMNNLYSNAFKFTPEQGHISTSITLMEENDAEFVKISVSDTGCGISEKDIHTIFDRFYQSDNKESGMIGTGIGLHLVKEYVSLHNGKVEVISQLNQGSTFSVFIPTHLAGDGTSVKQPELSDNEPEAVTDKRKKLLIVEDNAEFRRFLIEQLTVEFITIEAGDGEEGEQLALQHAPDLIISDLMMPKIDGLEMCERLKTNIQTSHIPLILLTARTSDEAKIESYKAGADSYIGKPFNFDVLLARINMLIEQQEKRKELFHKTIEITPSTITTTSLDEKLVQNALQSVEKNMDNTEYSVDDLSADIGLSRSQLYRKLQSITGKSPNEFIQLVRLKRAAQLLMDSQYNISEIADFVGYNTIKYFNKHFKEEFGMTPSRYRTEKAIL